MRIKLLLFMLSGLLFFTIYSADVNGILKLGTSLDLSRGGSIAGRSVQEGMSAIVDHATIPGLQLKIDSRDDEYDPQKALSNVQSFIDDKIDILFMPTGSATFERYADLLKTSQLLTLFPVPGLPEKHDTSMRYCIYLRPSYGDQAAVLSRYIVQEIKPKPTKIILFYQDDAFGKACLNAAKKIFTDEHIEIVELPYERNTTNLTAQVATIKKSDANALGMFATAIVAKRLLEALEEKGESLSRWKLFGIDDVSQHPMKQFIEKRGMRIITSNGVPNPSKCELELVKEYREQVKIADIYSLEAYIGASVLVDILSKLQKPITKEKIVDALEGLHDYTIKGFPLNFNKEKRQLINTIWINNGSDEWEKKDL